FFSSRRRHTRSKRDWSSDVCSSDLFCSNTQPKIFPTTTRSCLTVRERITNEKSWPCLECPRRKFAMLIRANVSKSHRLFFLPWTDRKSVVEGKSVECGWRLID